MKKGLNESAIEKEVKAKMSEYGGYLTNSGALYLIAKEHGIGLIEGSESSSESSTKENIDYDEFRVKISNLTEGLDYFVILGKITRIFKVRAFVKKDGSTGAVASFIVQDDSGSVKVNLWDQQAKIAENELFKENLGVRIVGAYLKKGLNGELELNAGKKAKIALNPDSPLLSRLKISQQNESDFQYKSFKDVEVVLIQDALDKEGFVSGIRGTIFRMEELKDITLKSGEKTFVWKFLVSDDSATIRVNMWGLDAIECVKSFREGDLIRITNALVKLNSYSGEKELTLAKKSIIEKLEV